MSRSGLRDTVDRHGQPSYHDATFTRYSTGDGAVLGAGALRRPGSEDRSAIVEQGRTHQEPVCRSPTGQEPVPSAPSMASARLFGRMSVQCSST